jgi:hypothetical protein
MYSIILKHPVALRYLSGLVITVYNETIYVHFNNTIAADSLKLIIMFNVIKMYTFKYI